MEEQVAGGLGLKLTQSNVQRNPALTHQPTLFRLEFGLLFGKGEEPIQGLPRKATQAEALHPTDAFAASSWICAQGIGNLLGICRVNQRVAGRSRAAVRAKEARAA